jgi:hypothetical protein
VISRGGHFARYTPPSLGGASSLPGATGLGYQENSDEPSGRPYQEWSGQSLRSAIVTAARYVLIVGGV